jgi:hypothetical protein
MGNLDKSEKPPPSGTVTLVEIATSFRRATRKDFE